MNIKECVDCREVRRDVANPGLYYCDLQQQPFPDAEHCAFFQPEPMVAPVAAEFGTDPHWDGIAFADVAQ